MFIDSFKQHFESVADPRQSAKVTYPFFDILFGSLCAVIAGAHGWFDNREYRDWETDRKSTRLNSSHITRSRMPSSA